MAKTSAILESIESRFMEVANLEGDLSILPMPKEHHLQVKTNKEKSDSFGEVFTPIWLVDRMLERMSEYDWRNSKLSSLDLCSGYGQFSVRMLRKKYNLLSEEFNIKNFLFKTHYFAELQLSSCYKLLHIYSPKINLFIGDAREIPNLPENCSGIYIHKNGAWVECTEFVKYIFGKPKKTYSVKAEHEFIMKLQDFIDGNNLFTIDYGNEE